MTLATTWSTAMRLDVPIVNAPMGGAAGGRLAAAVSTAGGLGMVGMGSSATPEQLKAELAALGELSRPFGIGLVHWVMQDRPELLDMAVAARPALLSVSFGADWAWVAKAHDAGVRVATQVATQVATVEAARRAVDAGVDVVVARGAEGGGHGEPTVGTLPLLCDVLDAVDVPVLAAGGITSARGVAAVLA
ncbi:2-nitropropane dioxygenase, partial [Mycobacterium sp. SWH-M3]